MLVLAEAVARESGAIQFSSAWDAGKTSRRPDGAAAAWGRRR